MIPRTTIRAMVVTCLIAWGGYITVANYFASMEVDRQRNKIGALEARVQQPTQRLTGRRECVATA